MNIDEVMKRMELDETEDAPLMTPINYAKVRPIEPQSVYYALRTGKLKTERCNCGRKCINKDAADDYYRKKRGPEAWPWGKERDVDDQDLGRT